MKFSIEKWGKYRKKVLALGEVINSYKDKKGKIDINSNEIIKKYQDEIDIILSNCSFYLDRCKIKSGLPLWFYNNKNPETHASNVEFKYKDRMSKKEIDDYGEEFMTKISEKKVEECILPEI